MMPLRFWEIWDHLIPHLSSPRMLTILQGGKVYLEGQDYSQPEGPETSPWGRLVIVPSRNFWQDAVGIGPTRSLSFLTRGEVHPILSTGFNPQKTLDAIQDEAFIRLNGHVIPPFKYVMGASPLWMARGSQPIPSWDDQRGMWFASAEWRCELAPGTS